MLAPSLKRLPAPALVLEADCHCHVDETTMLLVWQALWNIMQTEKHMPIAAVAAAWA